VLSPRILFATNALHEYSVLPIETVQSVLSFIVEVEIEITSQRKGNSS
jgi:hypothetical protein